MKELGKIEVRGKRENGKNLTEQNCGVASTTSIVLKMEELLGVPGFCLNGGRKRETWGGRDGR